MSAARRKTRCGLRLRAIADSGAVRVEALALAQRLDETARLERARGGEVQREGGRMRLTSRDGLQTLLERGGLEGPEYEAGLMYRRCFETLTAGPRSNLNRDFMSGVRGMAEAPADGFAELRALRAQQLARWEALSGGGRQLWVLRLVAGQGRTINSLGSGGSARLANTRALGEVLRAIAVDRGLRRLGSREPDSAGRRSAPQPSLIIAQRTAKSSRRGSYSHDAQGGTMRGIGQKRLGLLSALASFVLIVPGIAPRAAAAPVESYGRLPDLEDVGISPDGTQLAFVGAQGENRSITVVPVGGRGATSVMPIGKAKLRSLSWADSTHLLIVSSTTSLPPFGVSGDTQEFFMGFVYYLPNRKLSQLKPSGDSLSLNVILGHPFVRTVGGRAVVLFKAVTFVGGRGEPNLYAFDLNSKLTRAVADGEPGLLDYMLDPNGAVVARNVWVNGRWTLKVRVGGAWRSLPTVDAPISPPTMMGLGPLGKAILFIGEVEGKPGWHALSLENGSWAPVNYAADALLSDPRTGLGMGLMRETDHYIFNFFDPQMQETWAKIQKAFPGEQVDFVSISDDHKKIVVRVFGQTNGAAYMLVDMNTGHADLIGDLYKDVPPEQVANTRTVAYTAGDGLQIPAYLTLPKGRPAKNLPLVVLPHGGPAARDELEFDWMAQALASKGYAVLQPEFRGSAGLSGDLFRAGFGQWGRKMQTDLSDGVRYLAAQGVIDPKRVCIAGASYGGYAALAGATLDAGVYRCAVSVSGPSDMRRMVDWTTSRTSAKAPTLRYFDRYMGAEKQRDPTYGQISPINSVAKISIPVLVIHGRDDTVVPFEQSQRMVDAMKAAGKSVQFVPLPGEDHWLSRSETRQQMLTAMVSFIEANNPADSAPAPTPVAAASQ